jgi:hypothetical protein
MTPRPRRPRLHRSSLTSLAALVLALVAALPVAAAGTDGPAAGTDGPTVDPSTAASPRFSVELYERGDFVSQTNLVQCVGASMQMMLNMIGPENDRTRGDAASLFSCPLLRDPTSAGSGRKGASARAGRWASRAR